MLLHNELMHREVHGAPIKANNTLPDFINNTFETVSLFL